MGLRESSGAVVVMLAAVAMSGAKPTAASAGVAAPASAEDLLHGPSVVYYESSGVLQDAVLTLIDGEHAGDDTCPFSFEGRVAPDEELEYVERAYDPDTCQSVYEVGIPTDGAMPWDAFAGSVGPNDVESQDAITSTASANSRAAAVRRNAGIWSWFDDPPRWLRNCDVDDDTCAPDPVSEVKNDVTWWPDGTCTLVAGQVGFVHTYLAMLEEAGWTLEDFTWDRTQQLPPSPCSTPIHSKTTAHFENRVFCAALVAPVQALFPTKNNYEPSGYRYSATEVRGTRAFYRSRGYAANCSKVTTGHGT